VTGQYAYAGKILRVDLSSGKITSVPTAEYADRFLGGRGIAAKIYWDEVPANVKAFDPENRIIFVTGPLAGIGGLSGSRWQVCGKAPAMYPEEFSYCNLGGRWGWQLKCAGYDALVIVGKSEKPVYLFIQDDKVEIRDASSLWGKSTVETRETLKSEFGSNFAVVACGPAGENLVSYAIILADNDASGSSGFGAKFTDSINPDRISKPYEDTLKAEVQRAISADEEAIQRLCANYIENVRAYTQRERVKNRYTGRDDEPDERLMRSIEEKIDIPESRKDDFRQEIMNYIGALALDGKRFEYNTNARLYKALELKLFEDQRDTIKLKNLVSTIVDDETQQKIDIVKQRLIKQFCEVLDENHFVN